MKYPQTWYESTDFYPDGDIPIAEHRQKVVRVRKTHTCFMCEREIRPGGEALRETGFLDGECVSSYTCIECCDKWLDELVEIGVMSHG
jgi:hypothetical protein